MNESMSALGSEARGVAPSHAVRAPTRGPACLEESDGLAVKGEGDLVDVHPFPCLHVSVLAELVAPHLVRARLEVQQSRSVGVDDHGAACVPVWAEPRAEATPPCRFAICVSEQRVDVEAEEVELGEDAIHRELLRDRLDVLQDDARDRRTGFLDQLGERHLEVQQLVVVDVEEPINPVTRALVKRAEDLRFLPLHQGVVVAVLGVVRLYVLGNMRHGHKRRKLSGGEQRQQLRRVFHVDKHVADPKGKVVPQPPLESMRLAGHERDGNAQSGVGARLARAIVLNAPRAGS